MYRFGVVALVLLTACGGGGSADTSLDSVAPSATDSFGSSDDDSVATTADEIDRVTVGGGAAGIPYPILVSANQIWAVNRTDRVALGFDPETLEPGESGIDLPTFGGSFVFAP